MASPPDARWVLRGRTEPHRDQLFPLSGAMFLGRLATCELAFPDSRLSRRHAQFIESPGGLVVRDVGSGLGTFVNDARIAGEVRLNPGDVLRAAGLEFVVEHQLGPPRPAAVDKLTGGPKRGPWL